MEEILNKILSKLDSIESDVKTIKDSQNSIEQKIDYICNQTADLTEFRTETKDKLNSISHDIKFVKHKVQETEEDVFTIQNHLKIIK